MATIKVEKADDLKQFFAEVSILQVEVHSWGASVAIPKDKLAALPANARLVNGSKLLCQYEALEEVRQVVRQISGYLTSPFASKVRRLNKYFRSGMYGVRADAILEVFDDLENLSALLMEKRQALGEHYEEYQERDALSKGKGGLGDLFDPNDYPPLEQMLSKWWLDYRVFDIAEPSGVKGQVSRATQARMKEQINQMIAGFRDEFRQQAHAGLSKVFAGLTESLTPGQDGKMKRFHDTAIGNVLEAVESILKYQPGEADDLRAVAQQIKAVLANGSPITAERLKTDADLRAKILGAAEGVNAALSAIVTGKPTRRFLKKD